MTLVVQTSSPTASTRVITVLILSSCDIIDEHVQHMLEHDVIEPAASPWCSNLVMVRKQDNTMRLCVNYRKLNGLTTKDKFLLPKIDNLS